MSDEEVRYTGVEFKVRASPTQSPDQLVSQLISQLEPYLRQVFSSYQITYKIRIIVQPVFVRTPQPAVTVKTIVRKPVSQEELPEDEEDGSMEEEETE